jgi:spore maturation protein CgeB
MKILCVGPIWRGSNAGGLFKALARQGCLIDIVDEYYYLSFHATSLVTKIAQRAIRSLQLREFNAAIVKSVNTFKPDILFVYKGAFVMPETLDYARSKGCRLVMFYPDVSMATHGKYLALSIPRYELVFTTKTFGIADLKNAFGITNARFIPHGFDPEVHRKTVISQTDEAVFGCDASFIGTYSAKKEEYLAYLKEKYPEISLRIWGSQWERSAMESLNESIQHSAVYGDMYAVAIQCSKINLGILNEQVTGASSGDLITSRTFHIPGSGGFMLHERNAESELYFKEGQETGFFDGVEELVEKVKLYLSNPQLRQQICEAGYQRAQKDHSLDSRAKEILTHL